MPETIQGVRYLWQLKAPNYEVARDIERVLGLPPLVALVLSLRQITSPSQASDFLNCRLQNLPSPKSLPDLDEAVTRIVKALEQGEHIAVYGDYDVDGITATALLVHFLTLLGGKVCWYIPHRIKEGYGLNGSALNHLYSQGVTLVITVDCGSSDLEAVQLAGDLGLDVIVTDHHQPPDPLPEAKALVNPKRLEGKEGLRDLAGVGVAFYLASAVRAHFRRSGRWTTFDQPNLKEYLDLVALGTLADMAPLSSTNRILAGVGLGELSRTTRYGLQALKEICGLEKNQVTDWDVLFRLGPRLNAPGRLENGEAALRLLLSTDLAQARSLAHELDQLNRQRQFMEAQLLTEALELIESDRSLQESSSLVLASSGWHKGLLGLVASRLVERFNKPTILLTQMDQVWEGSGRSFSTFDLYRALERCNKHLIRFGGHRLAAGLALEQKHLSPFRNAFEKVVREEIPETPSQRTLKVDAVVPLDQITPELMAYIDQLKPFGVDNPEPVFCCLDFQVENLRALKDCHLQLRLRQGKARLTAIGFNLLESSQLPQPPEKLLFSPRWNQWQGERRLQLHIIDYC
jgi:single-stranded-DNA-specific exonuclease